MKQIKWVGLGFLVTLACSEPLVRLGQEAAAGSGGDDGEPDQPILTGGTAGGTNGGSGGTSGVAVGGTGGTAGESLGGAGDSPPPPMGGSTGQPACEAPTTRAATCVLGPTGELIENSFSAEARVTSIEDTTTDECGSGIFRFRPTLPGRRIFFESNDDRQWTVVVAVSDWPPDLTAPADVTFRLEAAPNFAAFFKTIDQTWALRTATGFTAIGSHTRQHPRPPAPPDFSAEGITLTDAEQDCDLGDTGPNCRRHWRTMHVRVGADSALLKHGQSGQIGPLWLGLQSFERHVDGGACDDKASVDLVGFMH